MSLLDMIHRVTEAGNSRVNATRPRSPARTARGGRLHACGSTSVPRLCSRQDRLLSLAVHSALLIAPSRRVTPLPASPSPSHFARGSSSPRAAFSRSLVATPSSSPPWTASSRSERTTRCTSFAHGS